MHIISWIKRPKLWIRKLRITWKSHESSCVVYLTLGCIIALTAAVHEGMEFAFSWNPLRSSPTYTQEACKNFQEWRTMPCEYRTLDQAAIMDPEFTFEFLRGVLHPNSVFCNFALGRTLLIGRLKIKIAFSK